MTTLVWLFLSCTWIRWVVWWCFQQVIWGRCRQGIIWNFDIFSCRMDTFLFLWVFHCRFCRWLILKKLFILINTSVHFNLFLSLFCFFLCFPHSFVLSPSFFFAMNSCLNFLIPPRYIIMTQYVFQSFIILDYHAHHSRSLCILILVRLRLNSQCTIGFFHIILW